MKDLRVEEPKARTQEATPPHRSESTESSEKARKEKKKKWLKERKEKKAKNTTPASGSNATNAGGKKKKDLSQITCYNYNKSGHYASSCPESSKI